MDKLAEKMAELADKYGAHVVDAARGAAQTEAYSSMMASGIALFASAILVIAGRLAWHRRDRSEDIDGYLVIAGVAWVMAAILFFPGAWGFLDPWVWTTINHPDLWIAKKVLHL